MVPRMLFFPKIFRPMVLIFPRWSDSSVGWAGDKLLSPYRRLFGRSTQIIFLHRFCLICGKKILSLLDPSFSGRPHGRSRRSLVSLQGLRHSSWGSSQAGLRGVCGPHWQERRWENDSGEASQRFTETRPGIAEGPWSGHPQNIGFEAGQHVGFAWQNPNDQLFRTTVREEVLTGPRVLQAYDPVWCNRLFERLGLGPLLDRSPFSLSEGQKKRVSFAAALASQPELIIFDEPTAGQDDPFRRELAELIHELQRERRTVVLVTHDLEFAAKHASRWLILAEGQMIADGSPDMIMANHSVMGKAGLRPTQRFQLIQALKETRKEGEID